MGMGAGSWETYKYKYKYEWLENGKSVGDYLNLVILRRPPDWYPTGGF